MKVDELYIILYCKCKFVLILHIFGILHLFVLCFVAKSWIVAQIPTIQSHPYKLSRRWIARFILTQNHHRVLALELFFIQFGHLMYQMCHHKLHRLLFHWHHLEGGDQVLVQGWHTLEQSHDNVFHLHGYIQTRKLNTFNALTLTPQHSNLSSEILLEYKYL